MKIERQLQGTLNTIFTEVIQLRNLEDKIQPFTTIEENRADITLKSKSGKNLFFIELKDPSTKNGRTVFDSETVLRELGRAQKIEIRYFGICNFLACAFYDSTNITEKVSVSEGFFTTSEIVKLSNNYTVTKDIEKKLKSIADFYISHAIEIIEYKAISFSQIDELFIFKIRKLIEVYSQDITEKVWDKYNNDRKFANEIIDYTKSQFWNIPQSIDDIEKLTHIAILMLISKLIFYKAYVDNQTWHNLSPMKISAQISNAEDLEASIWQYFNEFIEITGDFEILIGERSDIIFQIPFVSQSVVELVQDIIDTDKFYDFSKIPYDIIGRIFEELIRADERHKLGQYFTPPHIIDLILSFSINNENDKVFDPSCGSGTFLVRAYEWKKKLSKNDNGASKRHESLLSEIYGNDISGYPAYLSILNLSMRNTRRKSYPRVINKDFFSFSTNTVFKIYNQEGTIERKCFPKFNAIIGNPPYTRQEDIGVMEGTVKKSNIQAIIKAECGIIPSQRTSIYAFFFFHAFSFLKDDGYLAYIVQNSWLDTDYGIDLQQFILNNFEIIAIMDSQVERFFPTASVNTSIVILRKQINEQKRNDNFVKFILFKEFLSKIYKSLKNVENLKSLIENTNIYTNNEIFKANIIKQNDLFQYSKWVQFLRAPQLYFDLLDRGKNIISELNKFATIKYGIKTGCNEYFILKDITNSIPDNHLKVVVNNIDDFELIKDVKKRKLKVVKNGLNEYWLIEQFFLEKALISPKSTSTYILDIDNIDNYFLMVSFNIEQKKKKYPYVYKYIKYGEQLGINTRSTCSSRNLWYNIGSKEVPDLSFSYMINDFGKTFLGNVFTNDNLHNIYLNDKNRTKSIFYILNSTISWFFQQVLIRSNFGDGVGKIQSYELEKFPVPDIDLDYLDIDLGETQNYKQELGEPSNLNSVNPARFKLDSAVLTALGYTNENERITVLIELYNNTKEMIELRLNKAQSLKSVKIQRNTNQFSVLIEQLKKLIEDENIEPKNSNAFASQLKKLVPKLTSIISQQNKILSMYWQELYNEPFNEKAIAEKNQGKLF